MPLLSNGFYAQEFVPPGGVRITRPALQLARDFAGSAGALFGRRYVTVFDWAQQISTRANAQAPEVELGPCMLLGGMERADVPPEALQSIDGFEFAVIIPTEILQAAAERIIDYDKSKPFELILR